MQEIRAAHPLPFGQGKKRRRHRGGRMRNGPQVGIVEAARSIAHAVHEGGAEYVQPLATSNYRRLARPAEFIEQRQCGIDRAHVATTENTAEPVREGAPPLMPHRRWQAIEA